MPGFIDLGADNSFAIYDLHVRWQLAPVEGVDPQGRLTLTLTHTQLVLRPDVTATYVGLPYDAR